MRYPIQQIKKKIQHRRFFSHLYKNKSSYILIINKLKTLHVWLMKTFFSTKLLCILMSMLINSCKNKLKMKHIFHFSMFTQICQPSRAFIIRYILKNFSVYFNCDSLARVILFKISCGQWSTRRGKVGRCSHSSFV